VSRLIEFDSVKLKLRLNDDTLKDEIGLYIQEVDDLVNNRLRNKLILLIYHLLLMENPQ